MADTHPLLTLEQIALVAIGGFAGSNLRYFASLVLPGLPGTLLVNVLGSFALGFILYEATASDLLSGKTRLVVGTGFISSFTTYSTFVVQSATASPLLLVGNVLGTYALGFGAVLVGRATANRVDGGDVA
ncbi:MAG: CrcB family protein [Halodesulfurarchaeum sp.]